ncbi:MAG: hypothetical protein IK127_02730 [Clostridia bacterium]|nr:hypothetical protein [Clostridia bacterium]
MKKILFFLVFVTLLFTVSIAYGTDIKVNGLSETQLFDLYAQVQAQIQLNSFSTAGNYVSSFSYDDIERNPSRHTGDLLYFKGKIIQVLEGSYSTTYRVAKDNNSNQVFIVYYSIPEGTERFLEDDQVCVYAEFSRLQTYSSTVNLSVTVPECTAALMIRPVTNKQVSSASDVELSSALTNIRDRLNAVVSKDGKYIKLTTTNYTDYARHPYLHTNEMIVSTGKVLQVVEGTSKNIYRLAVGSSSDMVLYLTMDPKVSDIRILEDDSITIRGTYKGLYTYSSTRGGDITIPSVSVEKVDIKNYSAPKSFSKDSNGNYKVTKSTYQDYARRPNIHLNEKITFSAKVLQVIEGSNTSTYRMAVDSDSNCVFYVQLPNSSRTTRILEDDKVTVVATFSGLMTYESTLGAAITIPQCNASSVTVPGKATTTASQNSSGQYKVTKQNYESFARDEKTYLNKQITFTAKVLQVVEGSTTMYRLAVDQSYDAVFLATIKKTDINLRILEDDIITVVGVSTGLYSYNSTMGGKITIPSCSISSYSIQGYTKKTISVDSNGYYKITKTNFSEIARNPNPYEGKNMTFKAKVIQVVERSSGPNIYRVAVDSDYSCVFYVEYTLPRGASRILENDIVTLKGEYYGIYTYTTTMGSSVSVPAIIATSMSR